MNGFVELLFKRLVRQFRQAWICPWCRRGFFTDDPGGVGYNWTLRKHNAEFCSQKCFDELKLSRPRK